MTVTRVTNNEVLPCWWINNASAAVSAPQSLSRRVSQAFRCLSSTCKNPRKEGGFTLERSVPPQSNPGEITPQLTHSANECQWNCKNSSRWTHQIGTYMDTKAHRGNLCFPQKEKKKGICIWESTLSCPAFPHLPCRLELWIKRHSAEMMSLGLQTQACSSTHS